MRTANRGDRIAPTSRTQRLCGPFVVLACLGLAACASGPISESPNALNSVASSSANVLASATASVQATSIDPFAEGGRCGGSRPTSDDLVDNWSTAQESTTATAGPGIPGLRELGTSFYLSDDAETVLAKNSAQVFWLDERLRVLGTVAGENIRGAVANGDSLVVYAKDGERWYSRRDGFRRVASRRIQPLLDGVGRPHFLAPGSYAATDDRVGERGHGLAYETTSQGTRWLYGGKFWVTPDGHDYNRSHSRDGRFFVTGERGYAVVDLCGDAQPLLGNASWDSDLTDVFGFAGGRAVVRLRRGFALVDTNVGVVHRIRGESPRISEDGSLVAFREEHYGDVVVIDAGSRAEIARFEGEFPSAISKRTRRVLMESDGVPILHQF